MGEWGEIYVRERGTRGEMGERKSVGREMEERGEGVERDGREGRGSGERWKRREWREMGERGEGVERDGREGRGSGERCCVLRYCVKFK